MSDFEKLKQIFDQKHYGQILLAISELIAIVFSLRYAAKDRTRFYFLTYIIFDFLVLGIYCYLKFAFSLNSKHSILFAACSNTMIAFVELLVYYYFFSKVINSTSAIKLLRFLRLIFICIIVIFMFTQFNFITQRNFYVSELIGAIEFLFLLPPCFFYFFELLKNKHTINLCHRPSFWITTGIFFYSVISVPYYLIDRFFVNNKYEYRYLLDFMLYYLPFTINIAFLTKAFLCKKTLTI